MTVVTEQDIARYVDQVRRALADLPAAVRDELIEDLPEHLAEVAAEGDGSLVERLGPPEAYAAELRGAAAVGGPANRANLDQRISSAVTRFRVRVRALDGRLGPVIGYPRLSDFLRLLRPGWWVLRGYLAAMLVTVLLSGQAFGLLPRLEGSTLVALLLLGAAVVGSIWLGRRTDRLGPRPTWVLQLSGALLVVFGLVAFFEVDGRARWNNNVYQPTVTDHYSGIQDVYVYDSEGRLVEGARLFDRTGEPIRLGNPWCPGAESLPDFSAYPDPVQRPYPYCPEAAPFRIREPVPSTSPTPAEPAGQTTATPGAEASTPPEAPPEAPSDAPSGAPATPTPGPSAGEPTGSPVPAG